MAPYAQATVPETYRRHIVDYTRKEAAGSILVDTDARYLYYVMPGGKAIRYGVAVGEEALAFSGSLRLAAWPKWPDWIPRGKFRSGSAHTRNAFPEVRLIRWARGRSISTRATRTPCTAIHGTNQPSNIGQAISSGCIRMTTRMSSISLNG